MFAVMIVFFVGNFDAQAMNTGFSVKEISLEEWEDFAEVLNIEMLDAPINNEPFECYDINENGLIALGIKTRYTAICVYDQQGEFQNGFSFDCTGTYKIEWDSDNIIIYLVRSNIAASFDKHGECVGLAEIEDLDENWAHGRSFDSRYRTVGNTEYVCKNDIGFLNIFASSYSQLVRIDENGVETMLYDVNDTQLARSITSFVLILLFAISVFTILIRSIVINSKKMNSSDT